MAFVAFAVFRPSLSANLSQSRVSLSSALFPLQSSIPSYSAAEPTRQTPSLRFSSSSRRRCRSPPTNELPRLIFVPPSAFPTLSTIYSSWHRVGLLAPQPRARFLFRGFPHQLADWAFTHSNPLVVNAIDRVPPSGCYQLVIRCFAFRFRVPQCSIPS